MAGVKLPKVKSPAEMKMEMAVGRARAPQEPVLSTAGKNALKLGQSENRQTRSLQQGYEHGWYHGGTGDITSFDPRLLGESTGAASAKQGFFFARDPQNPPEHLTKKTDDPASIEMLRRAGVDVDKLNEVSFEGHGADTASGYARVGGDRKYKEAMRQAKAAEKRGDWDAHERHMLEAEDYEVGRMNDAQRSVAKYGEARDTMLDRIGQAFYRPMEGKNQFELEAFDKEYQQLFPYGWYSKASPEDFKRYKQLAVERLGEEGAAPVLDAMKAFESARNDRAFYANMQSGANVMPVALRYKDPLVHDFAGSTYRDETYNDLLRRAREEGKDAVLLKNTYDPGAGPSKLVDVGVVFDPSQVRSKFAAFDPEQIDSPDILKAKGGAVKMAEGGAVKMKDGGDPDQEFYDRMREEFSVYNKPTYGNEIPGTPTIDQQRYELTMKGRQEAENRARTTRDNLTAMDPSGTLGIVDALKTVGKSIVAPIAYVGGNAFDWLQTGKVDPAKSKARGERLESWMQPKTEEGGEILEEISKVGPALTGSEMGFGMHPNLWASGIGLTTPKQTAAGLRLGAERVAPFAKDVGSMASELYQSGRMPGMVAPNLYAASPDGKPSKVLAPANEIGFYSPTEAAALNLQRKSGQGQAFLNDIMKGENVKADEISAMGLDTFLKDKKNVTADEVRDYIAQNKIQLGETVYGGQIKEDPVGIANRKEVFDRYEPQIQALYNEFDGLKIRLPNGELNPRYNEIQNLLNDLQLKRDAEADAAYKIPENKESKFGSYALPGGENYREIVLTLPFKEPKMPKGYLVEKMDNDDGSSYYFAETPTTRSQAFKTEEEAQAELQRMTEGLRGFRENLVAYQSSHWDEPNALSHLRVSDRVTDGKKTLLVDEVQSDWHQAGREQGYKTSESDVAKKAYQDYAGDLEKRYAAAVREEANSIYLPSDPVDLERFVRNIVNQKGLKDMARALGEEDKYNGLYYDYNLEKGQNRKGVPDAPYKDDWYQLTLRRAIKEAVDGGYDRVALPTGSRVAERFDLSKQIDRIDYNKNDDGTYSMSAIKDGREVFAKEDLNEKELSGIVGKDVAKKIVGDEGSSAPKADRWEAEDGDVPEFKSLSGLDLSVGGEGMKKYYDEIYPSYLKKLGKKYGAQSGMTKVDVDGNPEPLHYMEITPAMRKEFSTGIHMKRGGKVQFAKSLDAMRHELTKAK
jgi:hypothetical protein